MGVQPPPVTAVILIKYSVTTEDNCSTADSMLFIWCSPVYITCKCDGTIHLLQTISLKSNRRIKTYYVATTANLA